MTKPFVFFGCFLFLLSELAAQTVSGNASTRPSAANGPAPASGPAEKASTAQTPDISLYALFRAAEGYDALWRPDWPPGVPPDLFYAETALSVVADLGDGKSIEYSRDAGGRILSFPVLMQVQQDSGEKQANFIQGRCEYNPQGGIARLIWDDDNDVEILSRDEEDRPLLCRVFNGGYFFTALEYLSASVNETWYDRDGKALYVVMNENSGQFWFLAGEPDPSADKNGQVSGSQEKRFYNSEGLISKIESSSGRSATALYDAQGRPRYLTLNSAERADAPSGGKTTETYSWQWDKAGRLVRFRGSSVTEGATEPSPAVDCRYEYEPDSRGNWTLRREISMIPINPQSGRLAPGGVQTIKRLVRYGEGQ